MRAYLFAALSTLLSPIFLNAQLFIQRNALVHAEERSLICVQGNFSSQSPITGNGTVMLVGDMTVDLHGNKVNNIALERSKATLISSASVNHRLNLQSSRLNLNGYTIDLSDSAIVNSDANSGIGSGNDGWVRKHVSTDLVRFLIPFTTDHGEFYPLTLTTAGSYNNGVIEMAARQGRLPASSAGRIESIDHYWVVKQQGINGRVRVIAGFANKQSTFEENDYNAVVVTDRSQTNLLKLRSNYFTGDITAKQSFITAIKGAASKVILAPNPAGTYTVLSVHAEVSKVVEIRISDINSHVVYARVVSLSPGDNKIYIPLPNITSGTYNVHVIGIGEKNTFKLLKL